jgi:hypothetical protein
MADEKLVVVDAVTSSYEDEEIGPAADRIPAALTTDLPPDRQDSKEFVDDFNDAREQYNKAGGTTSKNPETENRQSADKVRDRAFLFLRDRAESYKNSGKAEEVQASRLLTEGIRGRGYSLHNEGLDLETVLMDGLIVDFGAPQMQQAMDILGLKPEFDDMVKAENSYKEVDKARTQAASKRESKPLIEARKRVCLVISECNDWLRRRAQKEPQAMAQMVRHWNEIITELNAQAQARDTRKANEAAEQKKSAVKGSKENEPAMA